MLIKAQISVIVVIYNKSCTESSTCQALLHLKDSNPNIIIYDNSTSNFGNRSYCVEQGWKYLGGRGNLGISRAYNESIASLRERNCKGIVCLFDDDSHFDDGYFERLAECCGKSKAKVYVPIVYSSGKILSPCRRTYGFRMKIFGTNYDVMNYHGKKLSAINSGMAVDLSVFDNYAYDEKIFLDGVDHVFMRDVAKMGYSVEIFPYCFEHEFSGNSVSEIGSARRRFTIFSKDYAYILNYNIIQYCALVGRRAMKLALQYRDFSFIKLFLDAFIKTA